MCPHELIVFDVLRNQLRALPVEFTDVFEKVKEVELHTNPWTDLPPKWGKLWPKKKSTDAPLGYGIPEAVDFLYGMRAFYDVAEAVWQEKGAYHYTLRLGLQEFISDIKKRMPMSKSMTMMTTMM